MAEVIIKSLDELKKIILDNLKDGTVISIKLSREEEDSDD